VSEALGVSGAALSRAVRVADQTCSGYAYLRDKYIRRALILDLAILLLSAWLASMVFVHPAVAIKLSPPALPPEIWIGLLSIVTFGLSLVQLLVDWKGRAQRYRHSLGTLSAFVREYRPLLASIEEDAADAALARYSTIADGLESIPERDFLRLKRMHLVKVEISRILDGKPGASLLLLRARMFLRDNRCK
jgi:hypothetical protein